MVAKHKRILNTSTEEVRPDWLGGANPQAIERQKQRGQDQLVASEQLPVQVTDPKGLLAAAGVKFGPPLPDDKLFCMAELPAGWKKRPTDHSMWSELIDDQGVVRASIFYKAAFYDRDAFMVAKD